MQESRIRELYQQYIGGMEEWQIKLAIARLMRFRVPQKAWKDTMQELAIVINEFTFDPNKAHAASEQTILCRMIDNRIRMLAREAGRRAALNRRYARLRHNEEDESAPDGIDFSGELGQLVAKLTPLQQEICAQLMKGRSAPEIAKLTGHHVTTIYRQIGRIRQTLADGGFEPWSD